MPHYHKGWDLGFKKVFNPNNTAVIGAQYLLCKKIYSKRSEDFMKKHMANHEANKSSEDRSSLEKSQEMEEEVLTNISINEQPSNSQLGTKRSQIKEKTEENYNNIPEKHIEINKLLMKFFFNAGLDLDLVESKHFKNLLEALIAVPTDSNFTFLSSDDLKDKILPKLLKDISTKNLKKKFQRILFIQRDESWTVSFGIAQSPNNLEEYEYVYVDSLTNNNNDDYEFESFCKKSIEKMNCLYAVDVIFVVTNAYDVHCDKIYNNDKTYYIIRCFSRLINQLTDDIDPFSSSNLQHIHKITGEYLNSLSELKEKIKSSPLGEATKLIYDFSNNEDFSSNESIKQIISSFLIPVNLTSVFLNHLYQMDFFTTDLQQRVLDFIDDVLVRSLDDTTSISDYLLKINDFRRFFEKAQVLKPNQFWLRAALRYPRLATFAYEFLMIPAVFPYLDSSRILNAMNKYNNNSDMKHIMISLLLEDATRVTFK